MYQNKCCAKILLSLLFILVFAFPGHSFCEGGADSTTTRYALKDGKCMAYYCKKANEPFWLGGGGNNCDGMCSSGDIQNKYTAGGCSYTTQTRTCCSDGSWSEWDKACPAAPSCGSNQCWNGTSCEDLEVVTKNCSTIANTSGGGQLTRTSSCTNGGWEYGSWSGTCTCKTGYKWTGNSSGCVAPPDPAYSRCLGASGGSVTAYFMHNSSPLQGTPYNADYYYVIQVPLTSSPSASCSSSSVNATVNVLSYVSGPKEYSLAVSVPSGCKVNCESRDFKIVSKGWK